MGKLLLPVTTEDHALGADGARVTLVEYADFQCPSCLVASRVVAKLLRDFPSELRVVFRHALLNPERHPLGEPAAELAEFAAAHGNFWPVHHALFAHQDTLTREMLGELASAAGLDAADAMRAVEERRFATKIERDDRSAGEGGVKTTPGFFVNGELYTGPPSYEGLAEAVRNARTA